MNDEFSQDIDYITLLKLKSYGLAEYCEIFKNLDSKLTEYYLSLDAVVTILAVESDYCKNYNNLQTSDFEYCESFNRLEVVEKFIATDPDDIATTIINYTELLFGAYNSLRVNDNLVKIKSFLEDIPIIYLDKAGSEVFAQLKTQLKQEGRMIADMDLLIASICIAHHLILVTNNTQHFSRLNQLMLENWSIPSLE